MVENLGRTYFSSVVGIIIQFGIMLLIYSWITQSPINIMIFLGVGIGFGLVAAPLQLWLNDRNGDD